MRIRSIVRSWLVVCLLQGCATVAPVSLGARPVTDAAALEAATKAFYEASSPDALAAAVEAAQRAAPHTGRAHELAARLAELQGRDELAVTHWLRALEDTTWDAAALGLELIAAKRLSFEQGEQFEAALAAVRATHPSAQVREVATLILARRADWRGRWLERDALLASLPGPIPLAIVGPFDNDQGRAWDAELEPEKDPSLDRAYDSPRGPLTWRQGPPLSQLQRLDFSELLSPVPWQVAYAQGELSVPSAGAYRLAVKVTDSVKVWVDGVLVAAVLATPNGDVQWLEVPLSLSQGQHRVLLKSANRFGTDWLLSARLVPSDGAGAPKAPLDVEASLAWASRGWSGPEARVRLLAAQWAWHAVGGNASVAAADRALAAAPQGLVARHRSFEALWYNHENGRAADVISALALAHGAALPHLVYRRALFLGTQGFPQRERELLVELARTAPQARAALERLAAVYQGQGWLEEAWLVHERLAAQFPEAPHGLEARAELLNVLKRREEATAVYERLRRHSPGRRANLDVLARFAAEAGSLRRAIALERERLSAAPNDVAPWLELAEYARQLGDAETVEASLREVERICPRSPEPSLRRGLVAVSAGRGDDAVKHWRQALRLNPDQPNLAGRLDDLDPSSRGEWLGDVLTLDALVSAAKQPVELSTVQGVGKAYLVDDEIVLLGSDGSTSRVISVVIRALTAQGVDGLLSYKLRAGGTLRLLAAFSVDEQGTITQASERNREVFFRALKPGGTIAVQYRLDAAPQGYLGQYLADSFAFQGTQSHEAHGRYVLWLPHGTALQHAVTGPVAFERSTRGALDRLAWSVKDLRPLAVEPEMPPVGELAATVRVTTVPDWKTWTGWWRAILDGAFRESDELRALGTSLAAKASSPQERLEHIHEWVQEQVRYQQDYESFIAGVKPHPAPMVLERRYGDCKDKAVLFVQLAKQLGLEAQVALVLTRDRGAVVDALPMQQFNHAIVYVPAQRGVDAPRFFDPTSTSFDLGHLPWADIGGRALVLQPETGAFAWHEVSPGAKARLETLVEGVVPPEGPATGTFTLRGRGDYGVFLRKQANEPALPRTLSSIAASLMPGVRLERPEVVEARSIRQPAEVRAAITVPDALQREGETWRLRVPIGLLLHLDAFNLAERQHELRLVMSEGKATARLKLPAGFVAASVPAPVHGELPCMKTSAEVRLEGDALVGTSSVEVSCPAIPAAEYPRYRAAFFRHVEALKRELVLKREKGAKGRVTASP